MPKSRGRAFDKQPGQPFVPFVQERASGALGAPAEVAAQRVSSTAALVSWKPPAQLGGRAITGYRVSRNGTDIAGNGSYSQVIDPSARSFQFNALRPTVYLFTVTVLAGGEEAAQAVEYTNSGDSSAGGGGVVAVADPLGRGLAVKFYTDFRQGFLPDVFEPLGGGKPVGTGGNAYLQSDGSANPYNKEMQWMRPTNVRVQPSGYDPAEGNVLALITKNDGYITTNAANRTDPVFDYLDAHQNPSAGRDASGNPKFAYTGGHVSTQTDRLTVGQPLAVDNTKEWIASARCRWPNLPGYWPAFWMMPDPTTLGWVTERDIFEDFGTAAANGGIANPNIVFANLWNNGSQLNYNDHKRRSLNLSTYHTWAAHNEPNGRQAVSQWHASRGLAPGNARFRVYVDSVVFFDSDFYRQFSDINVDDFLKPIKMHFIFQGAQIGGTGSNGDRPTTDPHWRDLGPQALAALPIVMEVSSFGVWEEGALLVPSVAVAGHPTTPALGA